MKISDFQTKDVINIVDGKKLGQVSDIELNLRAGRIEAIVVPSPGRFFGWFGNGTDVVIPWQSIVKIGADVILVRVADPKPHPSAEERARDARAYRDRDMPGDRVRYAEDTDEEDDR